MLHDLRGGKLDLHMKPNAKVRSQVCSSEHDAYVHCLAGSEKSSTPGARVGDSMVHRTSSQVSPQKDTPWRSNLRPRWL
jgi:hypothetical protein